MTKRRLALFFTLGTALQDWQRNGHFDRERRIGRKLAERLGAVTFLTYGVRDRSLEAAVAPIAVEPKPVWLPNSLYSFIMPLVQRRALQRVDVLKTNQMPGAWAAVIAKRLYGKPLVVRCGYEWEFFHARQGTRGLKRRIIRLIERITYRAADAIILTSDSMKAYVCESFGVPPEKVTVVPNAIDVSLFRPLNESTRSPNRLIHVGRLSEQKNLGTLIEALQGLEGIELWLVGDGPLRSQLATLADEMAVPITFLGVVPNDQLPGLLNSAGAFVFPSRYEGCPKALLEAMACGLPVVATPAPGVDEVIEHGIDGLLAKDCSPEALRKTIEHVLGDGALRARLGEAARRKIIERYSMDALIEREVAIYEGLLDI